MKKFCMMLALAASVALVSCDNDAVENQPVASQPAVDLDALVRQATQANITDEEIASVDKQMKLLDNAQLKKFFEMATEQRMAAYRAQNGLAATEFKTELAQARTVRQSIFDKAMETYGVPFGQLSQAQRQAVVGDNVAGRAGANGRTEACSARTYPNRVCESSTGSISWAGYTRYSTPSSPNDCDYEYRFYNGRNGIRGGDYFDNLLIRHWGGCLAARYTSDRYARLLFGNRGVWLYLGIPNLFNGKMR